MPTRIEVRYRVVTPLFCSGADPTRPELRPASFKGVLRYWWRALAWSRCGGNLKTIRQQEDVLFGSAGGGQSRVSLRLLPAGKLNPIAVDQVLTVPATHGRPVGEGARYLGYGVMEAFANKKKGTQAGQLMRACLAPFDFTVQMRVRVQCERQLKSLTDALVAIGTLGGMGARSRKGYGSLVLQFLRVDSMEPLRAPKSTAELRGKIAALRPDGGGTALPEFTALSSGTRHVLVTSDRKTPIELLDLVGRELVRFRSWGHQGRILQNEQSEMNFRDDHDLMMRPSQRTKHPRRIAFGLPHNYGKRPDQQVGPSGKRDRRASPMFIHLHQCNDTPVAVLSFLPARFLPEERFGILVGGNRVRQAPETDLYHPLHEFLDRLLDPGQRKEPFADAVEVAG